MKAYLIQYMLRGEKKKWPETRFSSHSTATGGHEMERCQWKEMNCFMDFGCESAEKLSAKFDSEHATNKVYSITNQIENTRNTDKGEKRMEKRAPKQQKNQQRMEHAYKKQFTKQRKTKTP